MCVRDIVGARDKTTRIVFNDRRLMRGHACSSATVLSLVLSSFCSLAQDSFLPGTLHGPCDARGIPGTGRDKGVFRDLITSSTIMHADTTYYAHPFSRDVAKTCHRRRRPMLTLQSLSTALSSQKLARLTLLRSRSEGYTLYELRRSDTQLLPQEIFILVILFLLSYLLYIFSFCTNCTKK